MSEGWDWDECDRCGGTGIENYTCSEGTCDLTDWCGLCPAGPAAKARMDEAIRQHRLARMENTGIMTCPCKPCKEARGEA